MEPNKFVRVEPDSPDRCQGVYANGQCPYRKVPTSDYCPMHGSGSQLSAARKQQARMYKLAKWKQQHDEFVEHDGIKSLREEIGILRITMQEVLNQCQDSYDILMNSNKLSDLAVKIEKLVSSCHRLEASTGLLLDKNAALQIASVIVRIISEHVKDEDAIDRISQEIVLAIVNVKTEVKELK